MVLTLSDLRRAYYENPPTPPGGGGSLYGVSITDHGAVADSSDASATANSNALDAAIAEAGTGGTVIIPRSTGSFKLARTFTPLERQTIFHEGNPLYDWDLYTNQNGALRAAAAFTGTSLVKYDPVTGNKGVKFFNVCLLGNGEGGSLNGFDLRARTSGGERAWKIVNCQIYGFGGAGIAGHMWVLDVWGTHISRCGYAVRPASGADVSSTAYDNRWFDNQIYMNYHGGFYYDVANEMGGVTFFGNRVERGGMDPADSTGNTNRDTAAPGFYFTRATAINMLGNYTDANAGPGLYLNGASANVINNFTSVGNTWKRDGTGDNSTTTVAGVRIHNTQRVQFMADRITYGDPNDGGSGRIAPQRGLWASNSNYFSWDGQIQLVDSATILSDGFYDGGGNSDFRITEPRIRRLDIPRGSTASRPTTQAGQSSIFYDTTLGKPIFWSGTRWEDATGAAV